MTALLGHPQCGMVWEGFVIEQAIDHNAGKYEPAFYRTQDGTEADLVLLISGRPCMVIKAKMNNSPKLTAGTYNAIADLKCKKNFVITPGPHKAQVNLTAHLTLTGLNNLLMAL